MLIKNIMGNDNVEQKASSDLTLEEITDKLAKVETRDDIFEVLSKMGHRMVKSDSDKLLPALHVRSVAKTILSRVDQAKDQGVDIKTMRPTPFSLMPKGIFRAALIRVVRKELGEWPES